MWRPPSSSLFPYTTLFRSEWMGLAHVGGGRASWVFVETDTLVFDAVIVFAVVYSVRSRRRVKPLWLLRSEEHTSELQSHSDLVCRLLLEKKNKRQTPWCPG